MSIFGSRNKTTVGTSVARVIDDTMLPNSLKQGTVHALMDRSSQVADYVMEELTTGLATKIERFYKYGRDVYTFGLPVGQSYSSVTGKEVVKAALEADVGPVSSISYYKLGAANLLHYGWLVLVRDYGYNSTDNTFNITLEGKTKKVYLTNMQPVVTESNFGEIENGSMDVWGAPPSSGNSPKRKITASNFAELVVPPAFIVNASAPNDYILVSYCYESDENKVVEGITIASKAIIEGTFTLSTTALDLSASYFQVRFIQGGKAGYWMYRLNSGDKPAVEAIFDTPPNTAGTFFPWAYFRFDKTPADADKNSVAYKSSKSLLSKLDMDYDQIIKSIHENPNIADVEQAMLVMAVPAKTENEIERRYLFDFFSKMYISAQASGGAATTKESPAILAKLGNPLNETTIIMRDKRFKMALSFSSIVKRRVSGKIGKVGTHASGTNTNDSSKKIINALGTEDMWTVLVPIHYYQRQISENVYEELLVTNLKMVYWVWGDYTATADEDDDILLVPLDYSIVSDYHLFEREELYGRSLHYVFNSRVVTKLKWYQTGIFRAVMIVVAIVVMINNIAAGIKTLSSALSATTAITSVAYMALVAVVKYVVLTVAVRLFIKVAGVRMAFITAVLAAMAGMYQVIEAGSVEGAPWASELLNVTSTMTKAIGREIETEFDALRDAAKAFEEYSQEQTKLLDTAQDLLNGAVRLDPLIIWGESPDDFYQRTVHYGNIGVVGIEAISSFVEMKLTLPKLSDTLGEFA